MSVDLGCGGPALLGDAIQPAKTIFQDLKAALLERKAQSNLNLDVVRPGFGFLIAPRTTLLSKDGTRIARKFSERSDLCDARPLIGR